MKLSAVQGMRYHESQIPAFQLCVSAALHNHKLRLSCALPLMWPNTGLCSVIVAEVIK